MALQPSPPWFQAAVQRSLSVVFRLPDGRFEGHDYLVEVVTSRQGLDAFDVVVDFRDLELALDQALRPLDRQVVDLGGPAELSQQLADALEASVPPPAKLTEISLSDGRGTRVSLRT